MIRRILLAAVVLGLAQPPAQGAVKDELVIGITQFPSTFHPNIDSMMAKTYILAMTRRPFTAYDADWRLICMLCVKLPTIENGLAVPEKTPKGQRGIAVTYTIQPGAVWGDGTPVSTRDVLFTWKVGRSPMSGVGNMELYRRIYRIDAIDDKTFTIHDEKLTYQYNSLNDFQLLPAHLEERPFNLPAEYKNRTTFDTDATNEGLAFGPYPGRSKRRVKPNIQKVRAQIGGTVRRIKVCTRCMKSGRVQKPLKRVIPVAVS